MASTKTNKNKKQSATKERNSFEYTDISRCIQCGMCLANCPTYREFLSETASPRGRIVLMNEYAKGNIEITAKLKKAMSLCLDCRACTTACPVGIQTGLAVVHMRAIIESQGTKNPIKKVVLENLLLHPNLMKYATVPLRLYQRLGIQKALRKLGILKPFPFAIEELEAMLPQYQGEPLTSRIDEVTKAVGEKKMTVGFFLGCAMNLMLPKSSEATINVISKLGGEIITPKDAKCCGAPHINEGDEETARELARFNIDLFLGKNVDTVFTDCAACGAELKNYPHLFENDPAYKEKAEILAAKIKDVSEVILELGFNSDMCRPLNDAVVTYDEPCHLRHGQGIKKPPYQILKMIPGIKFVKLKESDWCCGSAGTYWMKEKDAAGRILNRKLENIKKIDPDYIITSNPGCLLQLIKGVRQENLKAKVIHLTELLQMALK